MRPIDIFVLLLQLNFIGFKLIGVVDWSWWWVLSPFLFCGAGLLTILYVLVIIGGGNNKS
jgi:hypothetical protein